MKKNTFESLFDEAADTYVNAFKSCVRIQEDTARQCFDFVKGWGKTDDLAKRQEQFIEQAVTNMKKAADDSMDLWKQNADKCLKLLEEGFAAAQAKTPSDAQGRLQKLWENSLGAMKENTETMVRLSGEAMKAYADYLNDLTPKEPAGAK
ncbi:MAG: hypothetical protein KDM91_11470 [Verrucomicrobiae bacterium]|nr:hypothetical protein [Verrucomicrobiae bacterium]MCP5539900.1 hypothetical protein [Akkermansiaceae bacterium]MCP5551801.1 hypothetical protein [Akkermansiaceae bacterium]